VADEEAEIGQEGAADRGRAVGGGWDEDVVRLDVSVEEAVVVDEGQGGGDGAEELDHRRGRHRRQAGRVPPVDELHRVVDEVVVLVPVEHRHDVRVGELSHQEELAPEPPAPVLVPAGLRRVHLDRHLAAVFERGGSIDGAGPAAAEQRADLVPPEDGARSQRLLVRHTSLSHCRLRQAGARGALASVGG
jgi:hypothetical protein